MVYNEDGLILGNNFENFKFDVGSVYLSGATRNWTVVGGDLGESIIDNGENNRITGFSSQNGDVPFGQTISEKLKVIRDTRHDFKKE